jgi:hypothetical protein
LTINYGKLMSVVFRKGINWERVTTWGPRRLITRPVCQQFNIGCTYTYYLAFSLNKKKVIVSFVFI